MTRNSEALASFMQFCEDHPDFRFWQALDAWSNSTVYLLMGSTMYNPFGWEGLDGLEPTVTNAQYLGYRKNADRTDSAV